MGYSAMGTQPATWQQLCFPWGLMAVAGEVQEDCLDLSSEMTDHHLFVAANPLRWTEIISASAAMSERAQSALCVLEVSLILWNSDIRGR